MARPRARVVVLSGLLVALATGRPLGAQRQSAVDVGFSLVEFPEDSSRLIGPSIGWTGRAETRRLFGLVTAGAVATTGSSTGFGSLDAGVRSPLWSGWLAEGAGELYGIAGSTARGSASVTLSGRVLRTMRSGGAWAGASLSTARRESGSLPASAATAGVWRSWPRGRVTGSVTMQRATGQIFAGPRNDYLIGTVPVRYAEGSLGVRLESDRTSFDVDVGARHDPDAASRVEATYAMSAAFWSGPTRAWILTVSKQLPDFVRGGDAARLLGVGVRFNQPTPAASRALRMQPVVVLVGSGDERALRVRAPGARTVEVMASFTDWEPVALSPSGAVFERPIRITAGTHRIVLRVDGGAWRPAANTPAVDDDLGGRVGLLVAP